MNIVDVLAIMPYYVSLFLIADDLAPGKQEQEGGGALTVRPWDGFFLDDVSRP
jgi:hypothetical protein